MDDGLNIIWCPSLNTFKPIVSVTNSTWHYLWHRRCIEKFLLYDVTFTIFIRHDNRININELLPVFSNKWWWMADEIKRVTLVYWVHFWLSWSYLSRTFHLPFFVWIACTGRCSQTTLKFLRLFQLRLAWKILQWLCRGWRLQMMINSWSSTPTHSTPPPLPTLRYRTNSGPTTASTADHHRFSVGPISRVGLSKLEIFSRSYCYTV